MPGKAFFFFFFFFALQDLEFGKISVLCSELRGMELPGESGHREFGGPFEVTWHVAICCHRGLPHFDLPGLTSFRRLREMALEDPDEEWGPLPNLVTWALPFQMLKLSFGCHAHDRRLQTANVSVAMEDSKGRKVRVLAEVVRQFDSI